MNGRFVVAPSRSRILWRSVGYGAETGAVAGAIVATGIGLIVSVLTVDPFGIVLGLMIGAPIAAAIGAVVGSACGFAAGLALLLVRTHAAASRGAIRAVAACGAGLLPAAWVVALAVGTSHRWLSVAAALTLVTVALAVELGPHAFFGKPA